MKKYRRSERVHWVKHVYGPKYTLFMAHKFNDVMIQMEAYLTSPAPYYDWRDREHFNDTRKFLSPTLREFWRKKIVDDYGVYCVNRMGSLVIISPKVLLEPKGAANINYQRWINKQIQKGDSHEPWNDSRVRSDLAVDNEVT